ncbi:type II toxin-antitoxin system RelE/ParE family toxin [Pectobacterium brasiliense]|uniref:type II toxin-antitoxin system RelE/ParE family toxin n=1 Tax=Pectobacterium brasiliense TaxID=180957 RepID=UPI0019D39B80|nr:type II toxin-antitoxin system RelE/ParE family toxin [Pectobacterium brasiliense]
MIFKVRWEKQALADREGIYRYLYKEAGLDVANAADEKFISSVSLLEATPEAGLDIGKSGKRRKLVLTRFPFIIIYALKRKVNEVHILRILHTSRKLSASYR